MHKHFKLNGMVLTRSLVIKRSKEARESRHMMQVSMHTQRIPSRCHDMKRAPA